MTVFFCLLAGSVVTSVCAGYYFTCALLDSGSVQCWGNNENGELGIGNQGSVGKKQNDMGNKLNPVDLGPGNLVSLAPECI